jgi:hypothetical protein
VPGVQLFRQNFIKLFNIVFNGTAVWMGDAMRRYFFLNKLA